MHSNAPSEVLQVVLGFFEDLQTFGMDPCMLMIQIVVFSIFFNMFEMSTICIHENITGVIFIINHFVSRERGMSFNEIVNNIFFLNRKRYIYNLHHTVLAIVIRLPS